VLNVGPPPGRAADWIASSSSSRLVAPWSMALGDYAFLPAPEGQNADDHH